MTKRNYWLAFAGCLALFATLLSYEWLLGRVLYGDYRATGQVVLADGQVLDSARMANLRAGHFMVMQSREDGYVESSGKVRYHFPWAFQLTVEHGQQAGARPTREAELFHEAYVSQTGSTLHLQPFRGCLYVQEFRRLWCPRAKTTQQ